MIAPHVVEAAIAIFSLLLLADHKVRIPEKMLPRQDSRLTNLNKAKELIRETKYAEALPILENIANAHSDPSAQFYLALCLTYLRQFDRALLAWDEAIKRQPGSLAGSFNKGLTMIVTDQWQLAQVHLERAALLDPADLDCHLLLGACRLYNGEYDRAWEDFDFIIENDASREEAYAFRGFARLLQGRPLAAMPDLSRANKPLEYKLLGDGFAAEKEGQRALHYYSFVEKLQPTFPGLAIAIKAARELPSTPPSLPPRPGSKESPTPASPVMESRRKQRPPETALSFAVLQETATRLAQLQRLKQETQPLVVWQWRKVLFGEEEMLPKVPYDIVRLGTTLLRDHVEDEGIFRLGASGTLVQYSFRKIQFGESETVDLRPTHLCANLLGRYAKSLKAKFSAQTLRDWASVATAPFPQQLGYLSKLLASLSPFHRVILHYYVDIWAAVADKSDKNRMTARNIASVMAPNFIDDSLQTDLAAITSAVSLIVALIANRTSLFVESIAGHLSSADDAWENFSPETSEAIEASFQQGNQTHGFKIKSDDYEIAFKILLQMKVTDRNRQRPVRRRVLHHDQTTFKLLQVIDDSPDRPDGVTSLRTIFDVLSLLPKTAKAPHYSSPLFPGTDCLICPWPVPPAYQLEAFLGPAFIQSAVSYILQNFLTGPPAYHCWILPTFLSQCRFVLFVRFGGGEVAWSPYEGLKAAFHLLRLYNVQNRATKDQEINTVTLRPFDASYTVANFKQMALAYSELFTSSSTTRQILCGARSLESYV